MHAWWDWRWPSRHSWAFLPVQYGTLVFSSSCTLEKTRLQTQFCPINHVPLSPLQTADKWQIITSQLSFWHVYVLHFLTFSLVSLGPLHVSGDRKISSWRLSQLLTSQSTFNVATTPPPLSLSKTNSSPTLLLLCWLCYVNADEIIPSDSALDVCPCWCFVWNSPLCKWPAGKVQSIIDGLIFLYQNHCKNIPLKNGAKWHHYLPTVA